MGLMDHKFSDNIITSTVDGVINWARRSSLWPVTFGLACCAIEMMAAGASKYDLDRFGIIFRATPRQSDVMIVAGTVTRKMAPVVRKVYEQMPEPKWCIAIGECAISGGPFYDSYNIIQNTADYFPIDVFIPGCPPRPEQFVEGLINLQEKIKQRKDKRGY